MLWFDLMFDVQVRRGASAEALASISAYYARITTAARPMSRLIAVMMLATLTALVVQIARGDARAWVSWASLALAAAAIGTAVARTFPNAVRLGARSDPEDVQAERARSIYRQHVACFAAIAIVLALQLGFAT